LIYIRESPSGAVLAIGARDRSELFVVPRTTSVAWTATPMGRVFKDYGGT
jgi:hypothetical protein